MRKIFNLSKILGAISFLSLIATVGAVEGGMYFTAFALIVLFAVCAYFSIKEDGKEV